MFSLSWSIDFTIIAFRFALNVSIFFNLFRLSISAASKFIVAILIDVSCSTFIFRFHNSGTVCFFCCYSPFDFQFSAFQPSDLQLRAYIIFMLKITDSVKLPKTPFPPPHRKMHESASHHRPTKQQLSMSAAEQKRKRASGQQLSRSAAEQQLIRRAKEQQIERRVTSKIYENGNV